MGSAQALTGTDEHRWGGASSAGSWAGGLGRDRKEAGGRDTCTCGHVGGGCLLQSAPRAKTECLSQEKCSGSCDE